MRKLILFLAAVSLVLFAEKALCYETTFSIEPQSFNSFRYQEMRVEKAAPLSIRTGRFLSVDPVLAVKRAMHHPQGWNRYTYVQNNPINRIDPDGRLDGNSDDVARQLFPGDRAAQMAFDQEVAVGTAKLTGTFLLLITPGPDDVPLVLVGATRAFRAGSRIFGRLFGGKAAGFTDEAIDSIVSSGSSLQRANSTESKMLAALKSHADRSHASASLFQGIPKTEEGAAGLVRSIIKNQTEVIKKSNGMTNIYEKSGRGVQLNPDGTFRTFISR